MHESIERYIATVLRDTGIPIARRREIAEEIRSHLADSTAARTHDGVCTGCAARDAIEAFGPAAIVRRKLVWQQWRDDIAACRSRLIALAMLGAVGGIAFATLNALALRASLGIGGAIAVFFAMTMSAWTATLVQVRLARPRPSTDVTTTMLMIRFGSALLAVSATVVTLCVLLAGTAFAARTGGTPAFFYSACSVTLAERGYAPLMAFLAEVVTGGVLLARYASSRFVADDATAPVESVTAE